jgi:hypothetical protein
VLSVCGHRWNSTVMFADSGFQQYRQLPSRILGLVPRHARIQWHVLDLEFFAERVHVEERGCSS